MSNNVSMKPVCIILSFFLIGTFLLIETVVSGKPGLKLSKRSFAEAGCMGSNDDSKFYRLDRVCVECMELYRDPSIHSSCRRDCFKNEVFTDCITALMLKDEHPKLDKFVNELYG